MSVAFVPVSLRSPQFLTAVRTHYTGSRAAPPGRSLAWAIYEGGVLRGHVGMGSPMFAIGARRRLGLPAMPPPAETACCFIFKLDAPGEVKASDILKAWHPVAERRWLQRYGETIVHWETMVDPGEVKSTVPGACFRAAGYRFLAMTTGFGLRQDKQIRTAPRREARTTRKMVFYRGPLARLPMEDVEWPLGIETYQK